MDLIGLLFGLGISQGILLALVLLLAPSGHRQANSIMAALVAAIALNLLQSWLIRSGFFLRHPGGWMLLPSLSFTWGPLLYLYAASLTGSRLGWQHAWHFAPAVLLLAIVSATFWSYSREEQIEFLQYFWSPRTDPAARASIAAGLPLFWQIWIDWHLQGHLFALHFGGYCLLLLRGIRQHNRRLQDHFSSLEQINLRWLHTLTRLNLLFLVLYIALNRAPVMWAGYFDSSALLPNAPFLFQVLLIYLIGVAAIFQSNLIRGAAETARTEPIAESDKTSPVSTKSQAIDAGKYAKSGLTDEAATAHEALLRRRMEKEEYYLDCDLTLSDLAEKLDLSPQLLSQVINERMGDNFFGLVSSYRIGLAKKLLSDPKTSRMPVVELALEVGFKSKSSFYNAFKKMTGMTPTQFRKSVDSGN